MSRVLTFSTVFPSYHPRKGEPTDFVKKILIALKGKEICSQNFGFDADLYEPKYHTIRAGNRWKVGDKFSPRVWSGKPYKSKQIVIAPDIDIKKIWDIEIIEGEYYIDGKYHSGEHEHNHEKLELIAKNDGLSKHDLIDWLQFNKPFRGQIICWGQNITY